MKIPMFIVVEEATPIGADYRERTVNVDEIESISTTGNESTIYLKSGRRIENVRADEATLHNKITTARGDFLRAYSKYMK